MNYVNRIIAILYYLCNNWWYKCLNYRSSVSFSVRVEGKKFIRIGKGASVNRLGWLLALKIDDEIPQLVIKDRAAIGDFCHITAVRRVIIEKDVLIANNVYISDNVHSYKDINIPIINQEVIFKSETIIHDGAWIGENVCIIGASVGRNSIVGANSVVTQDIPDHCIAVGAPARVIKKFDKKSNAWVVV